MKLVIRLTIGFAILLSFSFTMAWAWDHAERQQISSATNELNPIAN